MRQENLARRLTKPRFTARRIATGTPFGWRAAAGLQRIEVTTWILTTSKLKPTKETLSRDSALLGGVGRVVNRRIKQSNLQL